ncbi:DUF6603 domain-containing protein [Sphaerisporangium aureirubrum]|uniref:DUF6603 domain-containing protein n=1 Tax=Sphaerisporangium aureirubrum TaxID=1544736 RepID=A0ABW1NIT5_9ACTN
MDLNALATYVSGVDGPVVLDSGDARLPRELRDFLATVPGGRVTLTGAEVTPGGSTLTIAGPSGDMWPVQGLSGVQVTLSGVALTLTDGATPPVTGRATGTLPLTSSVVAPVTVTSGPDPGAWRIALAQDLPGVSPLDLLMLGKPGGAAPVPIPPQLDALAGAHPVPATGFGVTFYPGTASEAYSTVTVPLPAVQWKIVPTIVELDGIELRAALSTVAFSVILAGAVEVDGVPLEIGVGMQPGTQWYAYLKPAPGHAFPGVAALASWIGGAPVGTAFQAAGFDASAFDLAIEKVETGFDWKAPALEYVQVNSLLTLGALQFDVVLRLPDIEVRGSLRGGPVPLTDVLSSYGLPTQGVPAALKIHKAGLTARPRRGSYTAELDLDDVWQAGPVGIAEAGVVVSYKQGRGFSGVIHGVVGIGTSTRLGLVAAYEPETGWAFAGSTAPGSYLAIGDLVAELGDRFGVHDLPEAVTSLALTELGVAYQTKTGAFTFACRGGMTIAEAPVTLAVDVGVQPATTRGGTATTTFHGRVEVLAGGTPLRFDAGFATGAGAKLFAAAYSHGAGDPAPDLKSVVAAFSPSAAGLIPDGISVDVRDVVFAADRTTTTAYLFMADVAATVDLSGLPVAGEHLGTAGVDPLRIVVASAPIAADQVKKINELLPDTVAKLPERDIAAGFAFEATLKVGEFKAPVALPVARRTTTPPATPPAVPPATSGVPATQAQTADDVKWIKIQRGFGPVQIQRIGLAYRAGRLAVLLDASITLAGLTLSLDGLSAELSLSRPITLPSFSLTGLGLSYVSGPTEIGGAFLRGQIIYEGEPYTAYSGSAQVKLKQLGLAAIGSYVELPQGPSLFVYAYLDYPIGGPPVFFVRGLAAGFGYNRRLVAPGLDDVATFPLIAEAVGGRQAGTTLAQELSSLSIYLPPSPGDYFLAVGVHFTSFEMIDSFVLLAVVFGHRFEVDVLGLSTLILPAPGAAAAGVTPIAEVQLALRAAFVPADGYLTVAAKLTRNSFLLSRDCHLTGGFAFSTWFPAENDSGHDGDFVITAGGYHPRFPVPSHYPSVPRLGFSWQVSPQLSLSGSAYFALTPCALMAGGSLSASWQDDSLHAWFDASMDFLIAWQPYHYEASLHVSVGASYTFSDFGNNTVNAHVGADVNLWGPDFTGTATIDLTVVSVTVSFGSGDQAAPEPVPWTDFAGAMLPGRDKIVTLSLRGDTQQASGPDPGPKDLGVADPAGLVLVTDSVIPSTAGTRGARAAALPATGAVTRFGVGPAGVGTGGVTSEQRITISGRDGAVDDAFGYTPVRKNLPFALWGDKVTPSVNDPRLISDLLTGYEIRPLPPDEPASRPSVRRDALQAATSLAERPGAIRLATPAAFTPDPGAPRARETAIANALSDPAVVAARAAIARAVLGDAPLDPYALEVTGLLETPQVGSYA